MDNLVLSPVPLDQLIQSITLSLINALRKEQQADHQEKLLTTQEVAKLFGVTTVTISSWITKGYLSPSKIGGRNRFKYSDVMESMKTLKKYKVQ